MSAYNINLNIKAANQTGAAFKGARSNMQSLQQQQFAAVKSSKMFQRSIQQAGMQVSDFAVQVGGGQSAILAFTQNAPQFVQSFGAIGGVIAAAISIGGVLALMWSRNREGAKSLSDTVDDLKKAVDVSGSSMRESTKDVGDLAKQYGVLAKEARGALVALTNVANIDLMKKLQISIRQIVGSISDMTKIDAMTFGLTTVPTEAQKARVALKSFSGQMGLSTKDAKTLMSAMADLGNADGIENQVSKMSLLASVMESIWPNVKDMPDQMAMLYKNLSEAVVQGAAFSNTMQQIASKYEDVLGSESGLLAASAGNLQYYKERIGTYDKLMIGYEDVLGSERGLTAAIIANNVLYEKRFATIDNLDAFGGPGRFIPTDSPAWGDNGGGGSKGKSDVEKMKEAYDSLLGSLSPAVAESQKFAKAQNTINSAMRAGVITADEASTAMEMLKYSTSELKDVMGTVESSMSSAFMSMVDGTKTAADAFRDMAREIIKKLYDILVVQRLVGSFDGKTGTGLAGIIGGWMSGGGMFGNFTNVSGVRANGGGISAGSPYIVGERGPELIIPGKSGTVIPNSNLGGGGGNVTINNTFTGGVTRADLGEMIPKIVEASKRAVLDARKRGGSYAAGFGG